MSHGRFSNEDPDDERPEEGGSPGQGASGGNPFAGTPLESLLGPLLGGAGFGGAGGPGGAGGGGFGGPGGPDLSALLGQVQSFMQPFEGPVNWSLAKDTARKSVAAAGSDPAPTAADQASVADAVRLADHWLDEVTEFPSGVQTTAAWSRAQWVEQTSEAWHALVLPVAANVVSGMGEAMPEEIRQMAGPFLQMMGQAGGALFGQQAGQAIGGLAAEVLTATDIGLPLGPTGRAALVTSNVAAFGEDLDVSAEDLRLYLAVRECAHHRLFAGVPWLRERLLTAVADVAGGTHLDPSAIEQQLSGLDPSNPAEIMEALQGGLFEPTRSPEQEAALTRLETLLALVEGWVDEVTAQATGTRMPAAAKLQEIVRRRRAAGGPAEDTFAALVGLQMRPRRLRDASALWGSLRTRQGIEARDTVWAHPDLLPTAADLDDPLGFREDVTAPESLSDEEFDAELGRLLDGDDTSGGAGDED
ncbi:zinc-dependent metalloprotease [Nocardioidaceae bacterium]|nr:zinc-dependent metalloprotease [Nocardioidaceae bacterium]